MFQGLVQVTRLRMTTVINNVSWQAIALMHCVVKCLENRVLYRTRFSIQSAYNALLRILLSEADLITSGFMLEGWFLVLNPRPHHRAGRIIPLTSPTSTSDQAA